MTDFDNLYRELTLQLNTLYKKFIEPFIELIEHSEDNSFKSTLRFKDKDSLHQSNYALDVNAYTVLSHAALEEYFEQITLKIVELSHQTWKEKQTFNDSLVTLVYFVLSRTEKKMKLKVKFKDVQERIRLAKAKNHIDELLGFCEDFFKIHIEGSHGIGFEYLMELLIPVAIDINQDVDMMRSLAKLKEERGEFAHKKGSVGSISTPVEIYLHVEKCKELAKDVKDQANQKFVGIQ
ncbi:MAG: HEPN domain-containing protein [Microscillaceae bacterium]|nr:HEPN domain-containing protein [Microscillaceae bacterium]